MGWNELGVNPLDPLSPAVKSEPFLKTEPRSPQQSFQAPSSSTFNPEFLDENTVAFQDTLNEEPLFQTPAQTMDSPQPPSRLYSTPLSWERPQPGYQNMPNRQYSNLTPAEESQLLSIAMPRLAPAYSSHSLSPSPEPQQMNRRKRKSSTSSMSSFEDGDHLDDMTTNTNASAKGSSNAARHPPPKKTAHNMIEKRYRTNLNDKIAALRDSVPSLRVAAQKSEENSNEDLQGLAPAHKLNKVSTFCFSSSNSRFARRRSLTNCPRLRCFPKQPNISRISKSAIAIYQRKMATSSKGLTPLRFCCNKIPILVRICACRAPTMKIESVLACRV